MSVWWKNLKKVAIQSLEDLRYKLLENGKRMSGCVLKTIWKVESLKRENGVVL